MEKIHPTETDHLIFMKHHENLGVNKKIKFFIFARSKSCTYGSVIELSTEFKVTFLLQFSLHPQASMSSRSSCISGNMTNILCGLENHETVPIRG